MIKLDKLEYGYCLDLVDGEKISADAVIIATPANVTADLLQPIRSDVAAQLGKIRHSSIGTISFFYKTSHLQLGYKINGLMIPRREGRRIDAVTFPIAKMPDRAPDGYSIIRVFFGAGAPELVALDDEALVDSVRKELLALLGIRAKPIDHIIFRWPESFPQADVGHLDLVAEIESGLPENVYITGSSYRGIGVPDCVRQGRETARQALMKLDVD